MHTAGILSQYSDQSQLWKLTWDRIDTFLPNLREEVFKPHENGEKPECCPIDFQTLIYGHWVTETDATNLVFYLGIYSKPIIFMSMNFLTMAEGHIFMSINFYIWKLPALI